MTFKRLVKYTYVKSEKLTSCCNCTEIRTYHELIGRDRDIWDTLTNAQKTALKHDPRKYWYCIAQKWLIFHYGIKRKCQKYHKGKWKIKLPIETNVRNW